MMNDQEQPQNPTKLLEQLQRSQAFHQGGAAGVEREFTQLRRWQSARRAGVGELHRFLDTGFHAFRHRDADAGTFIATITRRKRTVMEQIGAGYLQPLELEEEPKG